VVPLVALAATAAAAVNLLLPLLLRRVEALLRREPPGVFKEATDPVGLII